MNVKAFSHNLLDLERQSLPHSRQHNFPAIIRNVYKNLRDESKIQGNLWSMSKFKEAQKRHVATLGKAMIFL